MARAAVVGAGMTTFGVHDTPLQELFAAAALEALEDAGVETTDVEALYFGNAMGGQAENETHLGPTAASHVGLAGIPVQRYEDACATSANAFKNADVAQASSNRWTASPAAPMWLATRGPRCVSFSAWPLIAFPK